MTTKPYSKTMDEPNASQVLPVLRKARYVHDSPRIWFGGVCWELTGLDWAQSNLRKDINAACKCGQALMGLHFRGHKVQSPCFPLLVLSNSTKNREAERMKGENITGSRPNQIFFFNFCFQHIVTCEFLRLAFVASGIPSCDLLRPLVTQSSYLARISFCKFPGNGEVDRKF